MFPISLDSNSTTIAQNVTTALTPCIREKTTKLSQTPWGVVEAYIPQCLDNGEYDPLQVHGSTGEYWCVFENGTEINGTRDKFNERPNCLQG
jgi:hypothetical protein